MYARNAFRIVQVIGVSHLSRHLSRSLLAAAESERAAQGVERTATREQQIGELEYMSSRSVSASIASMVTGEFSLYLYGCMQSIMNNLHDGSRLHTP